MADSDDDAPHANANAGTSDDETARQRRLDTLSDLARQQGAVPSPIPRRGGRGWFRWWQAALAAVIVLAASGGLLVHLRTTSAPPAQPAQLRRLPVSSAIDILHNNLVCPQDAAWSPSDAEIAVVGYQAQCPDLTSPSAFQYSGGAGLLNIYTAGSHSLVKQIQPDAPIVAAIPIPAVVRAADPSPSPQGDIVSYFQVNYTHVLWSPDGNMLALTFAVGVTSGPSTTDSSNNTIWPLTIVDGVELLPISGAAKPRILFHMRGSTHASAVEWDLATGAQIAVPPAQAGTSVLASITPALSYAWGANGALVPQTPLPTDATTPPPAIPPLAPIGNPDGGSAFTIWQPGTLATQITRTVPNLDILYGAFNWSTDIAAWSPDGRYLVERLDVAGLLSGRGVAQPAAGQLAPYGWSAAPLLPLRDAALQTVYHTLTQPPASASTSSTTNQEHSLPAAWSPDGRTLAIQQPQYASNASAATTYALYDCATGKQTTILIPASVAASQYRASVASATDGLRWSADGAHLLLLDGSLDLLSIWDAPRG